MTDGQTDVQAMAKTREAFCYRVWKLYTSNLSKAHVMRDSSGPATLAISVGLHNKILGLMHLERVLKFEASV